MKKLLCCVIVSLPLLTSSLSYSMEGEIVIIKTIDEKQVSLQRYYVPLMPGGARLIPVPVDSDLFNRAVMPSLEAEHAARIASAAINSLPEEDLKKTYQTLDILKSDYGKFLMLTVLNAKMEDTIEDLQKVAADSLVKADDGLDLYPSLSLFDLSMKKFVLRHLKKFNIPKNTQKGIFKYLKDDLCKTRERLAINTMMGVDPVSSTEKKQERNKIVKKAESALADLLELEEIGEESPNSEHAMLYEMLEKIKSRDLSSLEDVESYSGRSQSPLRIEQLA